MIPKEKIKSMDYLFNRIVSERLRDSMDPKYSLFLGAGCSVSSGILPAGGVINLLKTIAYLRELPAGTAESPFLDLEYGNMIDFLQGWFDKNKSNHDFLEYISDQEAVIYDKEMIEDGYRDYFEEVFYGIFIKDHPDYEEISLPEKMDILNGYLREHKERIVEDMTYSYWFEKYSTASEDIHSFLTELMNDKSPSEAYIFLADLFVNHVFSVAFTTNFDNMLGEALSLLGARSKEILFDTKTIDSTLSKSSPNIIKLHGDYMYNNTKNLSSETRKLSQPLQYKMENVLSKGGLIVVGYSGADNSIMYTLERLSQKYAFPLFWCEMREKVENDTVHWRARNLVVNATNAYFIPIDNFDSMVEELRKKYILYAKLRKNKRELLGQGTDERIYNEEYLQIALQRVRTIIDKIIQQNEDASHKANPIPPPN